MKLQIELPDPKFNIGDIVRIDNEHNDKQIYLKITGYSIEGSWKVTPEGISLTKDETGASWTTDRIEYQEYYYCTFEANSWTDSAEPAELAGGYIINLAELDAKGKLKEAA